MSRRNGGFTLVELLIAIVVIGVLAAIMIPAYGRVKNKGLGATMVSDLRNLVTAQENYFLENSEYYAGALPAAQFEYRVSSGVSVALQDVSIGGWGAVATHQASEDTCAIYVGTSGPLAPATAEGVPECN
jgi:prepilin-type N-terminal cleavage/methylation domain-containing protein